MGDIDKRDILLSVAKNGEVFVNVGEVVDGVGVGSDIGTWQGYHVSMPDAPDATGADQALVMRDGQGKRVVGIRCNRAVAKAGELAPGDSAQLSGGKARVLIKKEGDVFSAYTEMEDGTSMLFSLDGGAGQAMLAVGKSYIQVIDGEIVLSVGEHLLRLNADAITAIGKAFISATGATLLGNFLVSPLPTDAALKGTTGASGTPSTSVFIGP